MGKAIKCPYWDKGTHLFVLCEGECYKSFATKDECRQFVNKFCGNLNGWLECDIAKKYEKDYGMHD